MRKARKKQDRGSTILLRRRIIITVLLIVIAGFGTLAAVVLTKRAKADIGYDPYFTLSTGAAKIRIFEPLSHSVGNEGSFTASGTAPPNTTLNLKVDGVTKNTVTTDSKGAWTKNLTGVSDGDHQLTASTTLSGPFTAIASTGYLPGYSIVDLNNNGLVSASMTGLGTAFGSLYFGGNSIGLNDSVRINNSTVYLVRQRNIAVLDVVSQKVTKTIVFSDMFSTGGENPQDSGELFKQSVLSADGSSLYLLYSNDTSAKIVKIDTATNTAVSTGGFPASVVAGATGMVVTPDNSKIYTIAYNSTELDTVQTADGSVTTNTLGASARDIAILPAGGTVYVSEAIQDTNFYIATVDVASGSFDDHTIDLGSGVSEPETIYVSNSGNKLYLSNSYDSSLRVYDTGSKELLGSMTLPSSVQAQTRQVAESQDGSRIYFPLTDNTVAVVDGSSSSLLANIAPPSSNYSHLHSLLFYNNKLYMTYDRTPTETDALDTLTPNSNPAKLFNSLAYADVSTSANTVATPITVNGNSSGIMSDPVVTQSVALTNTIDFSVGNPIAITSPTSDTTLETSTPTITGTGPKSKTIQLSVNGGPAINVSVDSAGNWQKQVTLTKNKNNSLAAVYNNKRTQLVLPNTFVFGSDIAKNQLSVIDGQTALETNPISLPPIGLSTVKINTGAAVNPTGQRYYVVNTDFTPLLTDAMNAVLSGNTSGLSSLLTTLPNTSLGGIDVYSSQTRELQKRIQMPDGVVPISIKVSPDGKKAMVLSFNIQAQITLLTSYSDVGVIPVQWNRVDLSTNQLVGDAINMEFDAAGLGSSDGQRAASAIGGMVSGAIVGITNIGSYTADGSKFYTSNFHLGKLSIIDTNSGNLSELTLPNTTSYTALIATYINPSTNILYVTYLDVDFSNLSDQGVPTFVPGVMLIKTSDNSFINKSVLPEMPLFNFAVNSTGSRAYFVTLNLNELVNTISGSISNPQAALVGALPSFNLTTLNTSNGTAASQPITNTEIPFNIVMSPDNKQVYIPTIGQNVVHIYDVESDTMDAGNAPVVLGGISTAIATTSNVGEVTIGSYNDTASYYVPPDAPAEKCAYNANILADSADCKPPKGTNTNSTIYKFTSLPASSVSAQSLDIPKQTVQVIKDTAQQALSSHQSAAKQTTIRTWLVYVVYGAFITILGATAYTIWRTDMLLGASEEETYM